MRLGVLIAFSAIIATTGMAEQKKSLHDQVSGQGYGTAGCGLGSIIFGAKPGMIQIVAATFNSTAGNQTFGITSGTSNCVAGGEAHAARLFITVNKEALAKDISRGRGETLSHLGKLLQCNDASAFGVKMQSNFETIFPTAAVDGVAAGNAIMGLAKQPALGCRVQG